ncbi:MAG TPA: hypothetical protein VFT50_06495 [Baekduia sp.]|nr:hypothetical protein [Baekduia sp.]
MATITLRRRTSKKQRALQAAGKATTVARKAIKARIAWLMGKKATKVAAPAVAVGTAAVVVKKRSGRFDRTPPSDEQTPERPVESAPPSAVA